MKEKIRMRRNIILQTAAILGMVICVSGCGNQGTVDPADAEIQGTESTVSGSTSAEGNETVPEASGSSPEQVSGAAGYSFIVNGVTVSVDMDMDRLATELEESKSVFTVPSCTGEGLTYVYDFGDYEIETYPAVDGKNRIGYIYFKNDMISTAEGIDLSMTRADVLLTYGKGSEEGENIITYEKDGMKLNFLFEGEDMVAVEYVSAIIG